jgi:predicted transglutaminase-like cysteine proteinase
MYLTIARDLARRADHAVLVVRLDGRYWMLDNATDRLLDAGASYDYQPVLSFSEDRKWLHGAVLAANY